MHTDAAVYDACVVTRRERFCDADHIPPEDTTACARQIAPLPCPPPLRRSGNRISRVHHDDGELMLVLCNFENFNQNVSSAT